MAETQRQELFNAGANVHARAGLRDGPRGDGLRGLLLARCGAAGSGMLVPDEASWPLLPKHTFGCSSGGTYGQPNQQVPPRVDCRRIDDLHAGEDRDVIQRETELQNRNLDIVGGAAADMKKLARVRSPSCCWHRRLLLSCNNVPG